MNVLSTIKSLLSSAKAKLGALASKLAPALGYLNLAYQKAKAACAFLAAHPLAKYAALVLGFLIGVRFSGSVLALVGTLVKLAFDLLGLILKLL